jgi:hypothetical protein
MIKRWRGKRFVGRLFEIRRTAGIGVPALFLTCVAAGCGDAAGPPDSANHDAQGVGEGVPTNGTSGAPSNSASGNNAAGAADAGTGSKASPAPVPSWSFSLDYNQTTPSWPSDITHGCGRFWDLAGVLWDEVETSDKVFNWATMDAQLEKMAQNDVFCAHIVLARTPGFASSNPTNSNCHSKPGLCDPPKDMTITGTGDNVYFKNWVAAVAAHVNQAGYVAGTGPWLGHPHAHISIYETWNEPDSQQYWTGSYDQLARMEWDIRCIVKGCSTNPITGESGASVRSTVAHGAGSSVVDTTQWATFPASPLDTSAVVIMPSYHAPKFTLDIAQAFLYCTGSETDWHSPNQSCTHGTAGSDGTDAINFHMKWGNNWPTELEPTADAWVGGIDSMLTMGDRNKPLYNTEGGSAGTPWSFGPYTKTATTMQASFVARNYIYSWAKGITYNDWYNWSHGDIGSSDADIAYTQVFNWMVNYTEGTCTQSGSVYQCPFTGSGGYRALAVWDIGGTSTFTPPANTYATYKDLAGNSHTVGKTVAIGYEPILLVGG